MLTRRRLLGLTGGGVAAMGLLSPGANTRYAPIDPSPTQVEAFQVPPDPDPWPVVGEWELPGEPNRTLRTGRGRYLVGGAIEQESTTVGYVTHVGPEADTRTHRFDVETSESERIADLTMTGDGVIALSSIGTAAHRLIRLTRDGRLRSATRIHRRDVPLWFPRLFVPSGNSGMLVAGLSLDRSAWGEGLATVQLAADGTPQWNRLYGHSVKPNTMRFDGRTLVTDVDGYSKAGVTTELMAVDHSGLHYHRRIPGRDVYDHRWIDGSDADTLVVGTTDGRDTDRGYVARLDESGSPRWWRTLAISARSTAITSIVRTGREYRMQGVVQPRTDDGDRSYFELVVGPDGEVRDVLPLPEPVIAGQFGDGTAAVTEFTDPRLVVYRDMNHPEAGDTA